MTNWKDVSSYYSQSDKIITPDTFEAYCGLFRLVVHHYHGCEDTWFASCQSVFVLRELQSLDIEEAKVEAVSILKKILTDALEVLNG